MNSDISKGLCKISEKYNLKLLILFGSRAKNTQKPHSDWDLGYLPPTSFSINKEMKLFDEIITLLNDEKVDLINISSSKNLLVLKNIFIEGICIYEFKKGFFSSKKWDAWMMYQDFKKYSDLQFKLTKKRLEVMA